MEGITMPKRLLLLILVKLFAMVAVVAFFVWSSDLLAASSLPSGLSKKLPSVCALEDGFLRYAALKELKFQFPAYEAMIARACQTETPSSDRAESVAKNASYKGKISVAEATMPPWYEQLKGEVEAGLDWRTGNTELTQYNARGKLVYDADDWRNTATAALLSSEEDGISIAEQYRAGFDTNYKLNVRDYLFGTIRYVDDRFSGFEWRLTETAGLGRRWIDDDTYLLDTRLGPGFRQSEKAGGQSENDWLVQFVAEAGWKLNDYVELSEDLSYEYSPAAGIFNSVTALKSKITETLSFRTGVEVQHITDVPAPTKKTDTRTTAGIVYEFGK